MKNFVRRLLDRFERFTKPFPERPVTTPPKGLYGFCREMSRGMEIPLVLMTLISASIAMLEVTLFGFLGNMVDWLSEQEPGTLLSEHGLKLAGMAGVVVIVLPSLIYCHSLIIHQSLLGNYPMSIRWITHRYLLHQSIAFYQNEFAGRLSTKVMQTALAVREAVMKLMDVLVYIAVYFLSMVVLIAQQDWLLAMPLLAWIVIYVSIQIYFVPRLKQVSTEQADARADMTGRLVDSYTNINTVKLFAHTEAELNFAKGSMKGFLNTVYRQMRLVTGLNVGVQALNYLLIFCVASLAILLWHGSAISLGAIAIAISLALRLNGMSQWIMWEISALFENIGTALDGANTLSQPLTVLDKPDAQPLTVEKGAIEFQQLEYKYDDKNTVFSGLSLSIAAGEKVGLVGRSGAGKSTLVNLLLRFYDLQSGQIVIDNQPIHNVTQESLRAQIGMVTQDTSLLHRSVRENILYGNPDASEEEMIAAAKQAEAHDFILSLTDPNGRTGYDAHVGERGVKLSGGQRQRIAIARVLLKDAPILILDEATSALDSEVEAAIQTNFYQLMKGKTVIAIAHRLSTIAAMDRLIVIDEGRLVEQGTHASLIEKNGIYAQLWHHQSGGFLGLSPDQAIHSPPESEGNNTSERIPIS